MGGGEIKDIDSFFLPKSFRVVKTEDVERTKTMTTNESLCLEKTDKNMLRLQRCWGMVGLKLNALMAKSD